MLVKYGTYFDQDMILACDGRCEKAWGINNRPRVLVEEDEDDYAFLADDELCPAPIDPGTYEGGQGKPQTLADRTHSKWCWRECERARTCKSGEWIELPDYSRRFYNFPNRH